MSAAPLDSAASPAPAAGEYVVVARRYRPQSFDELVGQGQVAQALSNAITTHRVGHAYLFTGARGVGKTSTARIFAKALNCQRGPSPAPCNECDICQGIASGGDVDVLEIDGASNRGIEEIRQLRSNINVRPSRARFKIYIIDEVHMLTTPAFNALLKTLEEPPEHVKFIFCTTDPEKIPITVLSRCQRFDFPPVETDAILDRLRFILHAEKMEADDEALRMLARRAGGSMRDSQSLLEQLLSFVTGRVTVDDVHRMLGTARGGSLGALAGKLVDRDAAGALSALEVAIRDGVDVGQLAEQLVGYFRDMMAVSVGCSADLLLHCQPAEFDELQEAGRKLGLEALLAMVQILDHAVGRMRQSPHIRTLLEVALVRICQLDDLADLSQLIGQLRSGAAAPAVGRSSAAAPARPTSPPAQKKTNELTGSSPAAGPPVPAAAETTVAETTVAETTVAETTVAETTVAAATVAEPTVAEPTVAEPPIVSAEPAESLTDQSLSRLWEQALDQLEDMTADYARCADRVRLAAPDRLVVTFRAEYTLQKQSCERPDRRAKLEQALASVAGRSFQIDWEVLPAALSAAPRRSAAVSRIQRLRDVEKHPLVSQAKAVFDAEVVDVSEARGTEGS